MTDAASMSNPVGDLPERLVKHEVRYADHRVVNRDDLTPMMRHYVELKDQYPHALLLYRVGDFFETFFQDAIAVSREIEIVLTSKDAGKEIGRVPLAGIPHHALDRYCTMLVEKGYAVAICDQLEDAAEAQGRLVQRDVTRVITPGTVLEEGMLVARRNNFLAAVVIAATHWGLAYADVSTGEFLTTQSSNLEQLTQELMRLQPSEVLVPTNAPDLGGLLRPGEKSDQVPDCLPPQLCYTLRSQSPFTQSEARQRLLERFRVRSLEGMGCEHLPLAVRAAGGLLEYLEDTQKQNQVLLQPLCTYTLTEYLTLDHQTRRNLEITQTARDGTFHGSLLWALDRNVTSMGGRALRRWLLQPLLDIASIQSRQDTIAELVSNGALRQDLQQLLKQIYDLERLTGRAGSGTANARDLVAIADSLEKLPDLAQLVASARSPYLTALQTVSPVLEQLGQRLRSHLVDRPPLYLTEGNLVRSGVNPQLDNLRRQVEVDQQWLTQLEVTERQRTGIPTLKVSFNKTFGYYISISRAKSQQAPDNYIRKQTLTNEERYITADLKDCETRILNAQQDLNRLEYEIFNGLRDEVSEQAELIRAVAKAIAAVDVLAALAEVAVYQGYCRPQITSNRQICIENGRHPVVEQSLPTGFFVPNSTKLGAGLEEVRGWELGASSEPRTSNLELENSKSQSLTPSETLAPSPQPLAPDLIVLTGPNASGKSCYLRQVGLIQLMAQVGSFVPAQAATLSVCDRIFTRVGAVDDLATGQSTFMVEMNETANILNHATPKSLVLLDEIGRGTATFDGLSIAWAVAEHLATEIRARTIFATHYHELNELASILSNVANYQVTVKEMPDQIIFLHQVRPGGADRSYGIEAGRLAGLPASVIQRARQVMGQIEKHSHIAVGLRKGNSGNSVQEKNGKSKRVSEKPADLAQLDIFNPRL
ncbi:DNA mismatch repair protein MutS [Oculatella sp. FACHB-28]|uniref:DNA mismatch repair protein MutS n=1 Tax=Oculatella sp. FACHB-28 TaxID=2692845 RepID=UPI00168930B3|nr:DNA mismatch repair protein MutS [Oculatella sp. FACHB-28]MBD2058499.1 DNA mismatch repair protein MutS [Oculatella sp. FACHB-28]